MAFPLIQYARPLISSRIAQRLQSVEEDPYNFTIQYPIRREHFQDSFSVRPATPLEDPLVSKGGNQRLARFVGRRTLREQQPLSTTDLLRNTDQPFPVEHPSIPS